MLTILLALAAVLPILPVTEFHRYYQPITPPAPADAFGVARQRCADGVTAPFFSSLVNGETITGSLTTKPFSMPPKLSFWLAGHSNQRRNSVRLIDEATHKVIREEAVPGDDTARKYEWDLSAETAKLVSLQVIDGDDGDSFAWISFGRLEPELAPMPAEKPTGTVEGWTQEKPIGEKLTVHGIPFIKGRFWGTFKEGDALRVDLPQTTFDAIYILGCVNAPDESNPAWGGGVSFWNLFVGDEIGKLRVFYPDRPTDEIPLVMGYTVWWRNPYRRSPEPFLSDPRARELLNRAVSVAGATDPGSAYYVLKISLVALDAASIEFLDSPKKIGHFEVQAITVGLDRMISGTRLAYPPIQVNDAPDDFLKWCDQHAISAKDPYPASKQIAVAKLARSMYAYPNDISSKVIAATKPEITADNFPGPKVTFEGTPLAELFTNLYYENSNEILGRVDKDGMVHESHEKADNFGGFGGWTPGMGPFYADSYTRIRALMLIGNMGFAEKDDAAIDYFDRWLMYFPKSFPKIQLGGKPVPGHATVIANMPHVYFDSLRHVGWPTRYTTRDFGNPENDGHGLLMLTHYRSWLKQGRNPKWVKARWDAINEAAEYIPWCLDNPDLSFSQHGLLYNESEGGMQKASIYCDMPCYLGLLGYAEMAEAAGKTDKAKRWREQANRLFKAMEPYYVKKTAEWGEVWDPDKAGGWGPGHSALAPLLFQTDFSGYDAIHALPEKWAERVRNTYKMQLTRNQPEWCSPAGLGYAQCYITEAALLLDQMDDAAQLLEWLGRLCFSPRQPHPYRAPEGATVASDGSVWRRWGDLGNLYQLAEVVYTIQTVLGIDDVDTQCLRLMPRLPIGWTGMKIERWPVRTQSGKRSAQVMVSFDIKRDKARKQFDLSLTSDLPLDACRVRVGPFPVKSDSANVTVNGKTERMKLDMIGDSKWAWVTIGDGQTKGFMVSGATVGD